MSDQLDQLPKMTMPEDVERRALVAFREHQKPVVTWPMRLERWALQSAAIGYFTWAIARVFLV